jgi:RsmE family RNA methyltransferase
MLKNMNISDDDIDQISNQVMEIMGDNPDEFDLGTAPPFPFLNNLFGDASANTEADTDNNSEKEKDSKLSRWEKIAQEAARQSDAKYLPQILKPVSFEESLSIVDETECFAGALLDSPPPPIAYEMARRQGAKPPAIYVGPEGDFTPAELERLLERAKPVTFGETILRAETAAIYGLSVIKAFLDANHFDCAVKS